VRFLGEHDIVVAVTVSDPAGGQSVGERPFDAAAAEQSAVGKNGLLQKHDREADGG